MIRLLVRFWVERFEQQKKNTEYTDRIQFSGGKIIRIKSQLIYTKHIKNRLRSIFGFGERELEWKMSKTEITKSFFPGKKLIVNKHD